MFQERFVSIFDPMFLFQMNPPSCIAGNAKLHWHCPIASLYTNAFKQAMPQLIETLLV